MNSEEFRKKLVELVKASGQEVIDRAEELVGDGDLITDFDIWLRFPIGETSIITSIPTIEVSKSYASRIHLISHRMKWLVACSHLNILHCEYS